MSDRRKSNPSSVSSASPRPVPSQLLLPRISAILLLLLLLLPPPALPLPNQVRHCSSADLLFQFTPCDQNNNRWLFAVPRSHAFLCSPDSVPAPRHGLNCSVTCPAGHFLEMHSQQCQPCQPGSFSLGDRVRYEQFDSDKLPEGFSVENSPDRENGWGGGGGGRGWGGGHCSGGGWTVEEGELRYGWTSCVSTLSISLHLTRAGFAEFQYQMSKESRGLIQMLQTRNAQCQSYGNTRNPLLSRQWTANRQSHRKQEASEPGGSEAPDIRVQRLALNRGQNLITWTVAVNPVISTRMEMIRLIRLDISGLAFSPECFPCAAGTFASLPGTQQCQSCGPNEFASKGASRCEQCPPSMWAEPRSEFCRPRPACSSVDFFPVRPSLCNPSQGQKIYQRKISPPICRDDPSALFTPEIRQEPCSPCGPGMRRNGEGKCEKCPPGQVSADGKACVPCPANAIPEEGIFLTQWDSLPPELDLKMECEFLSAEEAPGECQILPTWTSQGNSLRSVRTRMRGVALELNLRLKHGFHSPLHSGKAGAENPLGQISLEVELQCRDSCQFYVVQEFESSELSISPPADEQGGRPLQMLALLNGTHARRLLSFPVVDPRPRRLLIAFTRSGAVLGKDELGDQATIYSLNVTNTGMESTGSIGMARACLECPRMENGKCQPCPAGQYFAQSSCRRCPPGSVVNQTALLSTATSLHSNASQSSSPSPSPPCSPCPPFFDRSSDGFSCEFSGQFDLDEAKENGKKEGGNERMLFDLSALKGAQLSARGIRVFARDAQSYLHVFNISLFPDRPVHCHDSLAGPNQPVEEEDEALFCRSAAIPLSGEDNHTSEFFVSSTVISRQLAMVTRQRQFGAFYLSDDQLEYEAEAGGKPGQRPLDLHFFYQPMPSSFASSLASCPNGSLAAVTVRCEPTSLAKPLVRLSRRCPDGTCDGCLYHAIVESAHGCPVCTARDFREIRGECINDRQRVHSIPAKHCVLSGAQAEEREESCRSILSPNVRLVFALAIGLIFLLLLLIFVIYRRNRTLEYRYSRLVEGRDMDSGVRSCALGGSDQEGSEGEEDEEEEEVVDSSRARVFFSNKKGSRKGGGTGPGGGKYSQRAGRAEERAEFIAEEESD